MIGHAAGQGLALDLHVDAGGGQPLEELAAVTCRHTGTVPSAYGRSSSTVAAERCTYLLEPKNWLIVTVLGCRRGTPTAGRASAGGCWPRCSPPCCRPLFIDLRHPPRPVDDRNVGARRPRLIVLAFITASVAAGLILLLVRRAPAC